MIKNTIICPTEVTVTRKIKLNIKAWRATVYKVKINTMLDDN